MPFPSAFLEQHMRYLSSSKLTHKSLVSFRYGQDANTSLSLDPPPLLGLFNPSNLSTTTPTYSHDNSAFYQQAPSMFPAIDVRSRLSSQYVFSSPETMKARRSYQASFHGSNKLTDLTELLHQQIWHRAQNRSILAHQHCLFLYSNTLHVPCQ